MSRRPFVVVDPRAGHGPGIGGFKADSEIGVAMKAGHPCYFIGFLPEPMPGQTIETIARAEAMFIEKVISRSSGRRRQALRDRQLSGRLGRHDPGVTAAGIVRAADHRRRAAGLLGRRAWQIPDALFRRPAGRKLADGARRATSAPANSMAPGWCRISRTRTRRIRSGPSSTTSIPRSIPRRNAISISSAGGADTSTSMPRKSSSSSTSSSSATISPPARSRCPTAAGRSAQHSFADRCVLLQGRQRHPAAAGVGLDPRLYADVDEIRAYGQTIVYTVHESVGHLGIFVSGGVAKKEHAEFSSNIDLIDVLPPGLYEATFEARGNETPMRILRQASG